MSKTLEPRIDLARRHLKILDRAGGSKFTFQTFDDCSKRKDQTLARIIHGTLDECQPELLALNRRGAGVFVTVNRTDLRGRRMRNIVSIRSFFADSDRGDLPDLPLEPSLIVSSKNGQHAYWRLKGSATHEEFTLAQKRIAAALGTDKTVHDPTRVMRLAGFLHLKDPASPFLVTIKAYSRLEYALTEVLEAFPDTHKSPQDSETKQAEISPLAFENWVATLPKQPGADNPFGGRNNTLLLLVREGLACGLSNQQIRSSAEKYCTASGEPKTVIGSMLRLQRKRHNDAPFARFFINPEKRVSPADAADLYLIARGYGESGASKLRYYEGTFYQYTGTKYAALSPNEIQADVFAFLQSMARLKPLSTLTYCKNVLGNLEGKTLIPKSTRFGMFLGEEANPLKHFIPVMNGIIELSSGGRFKPRLRPHTANFFSLNCVPYEFDPTAKCPTWLKFLNTSLPNREVQSMLQEWFGYNLIPDTKYQKFVLMVGAGANGKGVACLMLRLLLGADNISAVGLEQFDPARTFPISAMIGKLANIVDEIGESNKVAEGLLKALVAGGTMTVERKYENAFLAEATARLTFSTNVIPRFADRTDGLWRRMIPIHFEVQFLDPAKQDRRLVDAKWWESSNEIAGVFNWALAGLARLQARGRFTEPECTRSLLEEMKSEANPAATFLNDHCHESKSGRIPSTELYRQYSHWLKNHGGLPLGFVLFARQIKYLFPRAQLSKNPARLENGKRERLWIGLAWKGRVPTYDLS